MAGRGRDRRRRRVHVPGADGLRRRGLAVDPPWPFPDYFVPQGVSADLIATKYGFTRDDVDAYAVESQHAPQALGRGPVQRSVVPVEDQYGVDHPGPRRTMRPAPPMQTLAALKPSFAMHGEMSRASTR